jgi:hypothetical protein
MNFYDDVLSGIDVLRLFLSLSKDLVPLSVFGFSTLLHPSSIILASEASSATDLLQSSVWIPENLSSQLKTCRIIKK